MSNQRRATESPDKKTEAANEELLRQAAKNKEDAENYEYQQQQIAQIKNVGSYYSLLSRTWSLVSGILRYAGQSIGIIAQVVPPINAIVGGISSFLEAIEAVFISRETMGRRAVKTFNAIVSLGTGIAAFTLSFNPVTAPIAVLVSAGAITISLGKDAFFWYQASQDLRKLKNELEKNKVNLDENIHTIINTQHGSDIDEIVAINVKIASLEKTKNDPDALKLLLEQKTKIADKISHAVNSNSKVMTAHSHIKFLKNKVALARAERNDKRKSFFYSAVSLIGITLLAIAALSVMGAIVANPITLGIAGMALFGVITASSIKDRFFSPKAKVMPSLPMVQKQNPEKRDEPEVHKDIPHLSNTSEIIHKISLQVHNDNEKQKVKINPPQPAHKDKVDPRLFVPHQTSQKKPPKNESENNDKDKEDSNNKPHI